MDTALDNDEMLHLAIRASADGQHDQALSLLKNAIERFPQDHRLQHMLGAEYAEIGMLDRARQALEQAVALNTGGDTAVARFQLAMACILDGDDEAARGSLTWLAEEADSPLSTYAAGLQKLSAQQTDDGLALLRAGLAEDAPDSPLHRDMSRLISQLSITPADADTNQKNPDQRLSAVLAGGYGGDDHS